MPADVSMDLSENAYKELRNLAASVMRSERRRITVTPTALLHEALLRLSRDGFSAAIERGSRPILTVIMRNLLVDFARRRTMLGRYLASRGSAAPPSPPIADSYPMQAAVRKLSALDQRQAAIVELRVAGGCSNEEIASRLGCSERTVIREWAAARLWLRRELGA